MRLCNLAHSYEEPENNEHLVGQPRCYGYKKGGHCSQQHEPVQTQTNTGSNTLISSFKEIIKYTDQFFKEITSYCLPSKYMFSSKPSCQPTSWYLCNDIAPVECSKDQTLGLLVPGKLTIL